MVISRSIDYYREAQKQHDQMLVDKEEGASERAKAELQVAELKEALALATSEAVADLQGALAAATAAESALQEQVEQLRLAGSAAQQLLEEQRQEAEATKQVISPMPRRNRL